jgi:putative ABC transport system ATP-binding protein
MSTLLELRNVAKNYPSAEQTLHVLRGVDLHVQAGESIAITGPSGSGKSTLLGVMAGLERPSSGSLLFKDRALEQESEDALSTWRRTSVGFIFQNFRLLESLTAIENVQVPLEILGATARESNAKAHAALESLGLGSRAHHFPHQLSGGEQQRVAIARAYAHGPEILFADEPTGSLDWENAGQVLESLLKVNDANKTALIVVTHDPNIAARMSRSLVLSGGKISA